MNVSTSLERTVRIPITPKDLEISSYDTLFLVVELSDAIRRGVHYASLAGDPLDSLNEVLEALLADGEILFDDEQAKQPVSH